MNNEWLRPLGSGGVGGQGLGDREKREGSREQSPLPGFPVVLPLHDLAYFSFHFHSTLSIRLCEKKPLKPFHIISEFAIGKSWIPLPISIEKNS